MKILFFGAGPIGILYAHLLNEAGRDVTILARGSHYDLIQRGELTLVNGFTGTKSEFKTKAVGRLSEDDAYDLAIVAVSQNKIPSVLEGLSRCPSIKNILFLGNNVLGFEAYQRALPPEKILFGFPGAGGGWSDDSVEYVDSESPGGKRIPIRIGEIDGTEKTRTGEIRDLFENADIPVEVVKDIDGWLKYHAAFVIPICHALTLNDGDPGAVAADEGLLRRVIRACREAGNVLKELGYTKRQPFKFNLFYWMPEFVTAKIFRGIFASRFAEVAFALHARAASDEFELLSEEFRSLADQTNVKTPALDSLQASAMLIGRRQMDADRDARR